MLTKEIVENILQMESSDYDLAASSEIVTPGKTIQIMRHEDHEVNTIPENTEELMEDCSENEEIVVRKILQQGGKCKVGSDIISVIRPVGEDYSLVRR